MSLSGSDARYESGRGGSRAWGLLTGALLVVLGFLIAVGVGVGTGLVSQGQLVALFTGGNAASAPPATVTAPPAATPAAVADAAASTAATPAAATPAAPQPKVVRDEAFGDWRFVCLEATNGANQSCSISQQLRVAETGNAVFVWRIVQDGRGGLVGVWQVPETVLLSAGLTLDAGTPKPITMPFDNCGGGSCRAIASLAPDFIEKLSAAQTLSASVVLSNRQNLKFPLSQKGLADALKALAK